MKQGWSVTIEGRADRVLDLDEVMDRLKPHHPSVQGAGELLAATVTIEAPSGQQAIDQAHEVLVAAITPARLTIDGIEAITEERQALEVERSNIPDLVGLAEIAELAGTTRQRVFQMTANKGFPAALLELRSGRLWSRPAITSYLEARKFARGPLVKTLTSQVGGRRLAAGLRSKERAVRSGR